MTTIECEYIKRFPSDFKEPIIYVFDFAVMWDLNEILTREKLKQTFDDINKSIIKHIEEQPESTINLEDEKSKIVWVSLKQSEITTHCVFFSHSLNVLLYIHSTLFHYYPTLRQTIEERYKYGKLMHYFEIKEITEKDFEKEKEIFTTFAVFVPEDVKEDLEYPTLSLNVKM